MPRAIPMRRRTQEGLPNAARPMMSVERRAWLVHWKERAVNALPATVPVGVKVAVRRAVETALAALGPEDHVSELQDLVSAIVRQFTDQLLAETQASARETRKQQLVQSVDLWIDESMLTQFPPDLVGAPRSAQRRHILATLRKEIRQTLSTELTGDESIESVIFRIHEELAAWAITHHPQVDRRTLLLRLAPWALAALASGVAAARWAPELTTAIGTGARVLKEKFVPYKPGAKAAWECALAQLHQWAKTRYPQETPKEPPT